MFATSATFMVSAFWHGFYPFYYIMFFVTGLLVELSKDIYRARILFEWVPFPGVVCNFLTLLCCNYLGVCFNNLTFEKAGRFASATNYAIYIIVIVGLILAKGFNIVKMAKNK
jgi:lysophospholipid acyltransferase